MNSTDVRNSLRKYKFPICAKEALIIIGNMYKKVKTLSPAGYKFALEMISEFVFLEREQETFNSLEEIQVLMLLSDKLSSFNDEYIRNSIFWMCFGDTSYIKRYRMLHSLATMSMSSGSTQIMRALGVWIQQTGYSQQQCRGLMEQLVTEQFIQSFPKDILRSYAASAPHFVAAFLTCVAMLFMKERNGKLKMPPRTLLETAVFWVSSEPDLCMSAFTPPGSLDRAKDMPVITPFSGMIIWCSLSPLFLLPERIATSFKILEADSDDVYDAVYVELNNTLKAIKHTQPKGNIKTEESMYTKLMEAIKISLIRAKDSPNAVSALETKCLLFMLPPIRLYNLEMNKRNFDISGHPQLEESVGRMMKFLHIAVHNGCITGNISNLVNVFNTFPDNMSIKNFIKMYEERKYGVIKK